MQKHMHLYPTSTSAQLVDRAAVRLVIGYYVERGWKVEHMDIHSAFINER